MNPTYIARQMGHKNAKMLFTVYAKSIDGADRGRQKAKMEEMLGRTKCPSNVPEASGSWSLPNGNIGRRDWTRTNDPHHVKVVL